MCPPGTDQTERGPQRWNLLAPLLKERILPDDTDRSSLGRRESPLAISRCFDSVFKQLAQPAVISSANKATIDCSEKSLALIEDLPAEIIANILDDDSLEKSDVLALGACSETLWMHVLQLIESDHRRSTSDGSWAGTPLVYTGSYLKTFPPALLKVCPDMGRYQSDYGNSNWGPCAARRWNNSHVQSTYKTVVEEDVFEKWEKALSLVPMMEASPQKRLVQDLEKAKYEYAQTNSGRWYLRDLTSKKYVKLDVIEDDFKATVADTPWLTVDMVLLMQIRWSIPSLKMDYTKPSRGLSWSIRSIEEKGAWVGHSFDIVREKPSGGGWRDWTNPIVKAAKKKAAESDD